jgi:hypothetical protein
MLLPVGTIRSRWPFALTSQSFVAELGSLLDLNSLNNLSQTCRLVRDILLQNRHQLVRRSLRCVNDRSDDEPDQSDAGAHPGRVTNGRAACARDMVSECRRCNVVVCRVGSCSE